MRKSRLRPIGFFLTFIAVAAFVFHPNHIRIDKNARSSTHCGVCHTVPMGAARPQIDQTPVAYVVYDVLLQDHLPSLRAIISAESPRGPPAA